ncbi:MAG TPA: thiamine pyrophosphate-dependent enzyme [Thermoplasmata archaeon]|nr:thiamine pyrophosphate-dependent enzyme [Thermoplasmata archaeon]
MTELPAVLPLDYTPVTLADRLGSDWAVTLAEAYRWMLLARALDRRMLGLQRQGRIGFYGPTTGQEAVSVAAGLGSRPDDWIVPGLREQLIALVRGHPLGTYVNHLFANDRDPARGRQMPCHPTAREVHYLSMSSVVGTQITHAVGLAFGMRRRQSTGVTYAFFGDGATSANDFHAGLNFAGVLQVPVVFCCTNNQWAISVPVEHQTHVAQLADKAAAYGLPGRRVDGTDFVASFSALQEAAKKARAGGGPSMIEFVLFRMTPHSSSDDPTRYQAPDWMSRAVAMDPMRRVEELIDRLQILPEDDRFRFAEQAEEEVKVAIRSAETVAPPAEGSLTTDVLAPVGPDSR